MEYTQSGLIRNDAKSHYQVKEKENAVNHVMNLKAVKNLLFLQLLN